MKSKILNLKLPFVCLMYIVFCGCEPNPRLALDDYSAHAAVTLGLASIDESAAPTPSPKPSDGKCKNCKGVGKVGDGRTMLTCDVCKGTGREPVGDSPGFTTEAKPTNTAFEDDPEANVIPTLPFKPIKAPIKEPTSRVMSTPVRHWTYPGEIHEHLAKAHGVSNIAGMSRTEAEALHSSIHESEVVGRPATSIGKEPTIVMHSSESCGPCKKWIANELPNWQKAGWQISVIKETETRVGWPWYEITDRDGLSFQVYGPLTKEKFEAAKPKPKT